jgi:hypothetical protein
MNLNLTAATSDGRDLVRQIQKRINEAEADLGYL